MPLYSDFGLYYSPHLSTTPSYYSSPFLGSTGRSSGLGLFPAPRVIPRVSPLLPSIPEASSYSSSRPRTSSALDRYIPPPSAQIRYKPLRIDTADIDVSSNRYASSSHAPSTPDRDNTIKRGRTVVRLHTKKCKESPAVEPRRRMTPGEKLMQKFLILDKAEEEAKAARRKRLEEQEIRERAEAELARLQALAAGKVEIVITPESDSASVADASPQNFPTVGGITENAALDILLSATEDEEQVSGGEISRSSSSGTVKRRKSKGTVKATKKKSKKRKCSLAEGDETDRDDSVCTLQRRNTVRFRRNSQDTDAFPEVDLTAGSRRSSIDQSLPGSRRSSLDSSTGDETPLANQKKGTVKRRKEPPHRIAVSDISVENESSNGSLNSPKFIVEDVKVEQSSAPKVFRYEVIVEDVEGESLSPKSKVSKGDVGGKKKKKASDSDSVSSESDGVSLPNIKDTVFQSTGEKKDSKMKSFQKSQAPQKIETAAARLNASKTDESKIKLTSKEVAENLPLGIVGKQVNGTNKNDKGVKQANEKNKVDQKNVDDNKYIPKTITTPKTAQQKQEIQNNEKKNVVEKKQQKRQADPSPVEDSPEKENKESVYNFWDDLKPDEEKKELSKPVLPKKESSLPDISDVNINRFNCGGEKGTEAVEPKPIPKWKEKLQADKNTVPNKIEESKQISVINDNKKQTNHQKGYQSNSKVEDLSKDINFADKRDKQENEVLSDPFLGKKEKVSKEISSAFSASSLDTESILLHKNDKNKANKTVNSGKVDEEKSSIKELLLPTKTDDKTADKAKNKTILSDDRSTKHAPFAVDKVSTELMGKNLTDPTKNRGSENTSKEVPSPDKIPLPKGMIQESSLTSNINNNIPSNKKLESPESPTKKIFGKTKGELLLNETISNKSRIEAEVGTEKAQDDLSKEKVNSQDSSLAKKFVNQNNFKGVPTDESVKPTIEKKLVGQRNKDVSANEGVASLIATQNLVGQKRLDISAKSKDVAGEECKQGELTIKKLVTQESKVSSPIDELPSPTSCKVLVGEKNKEVPLTDETPTADSTKILVGQGNKQDESDKPVKPKNVVGQKSKEKEAGTPSTQKKPVDPMGKEVPPNDGKSTPNSGKKLVVQNSKDEPASHTPTKTFGRQKCGEDACKDEATTPSTKKLFGQKIKEDEPTKLAPKKLVGEKSKEEETDKPVPPKKLVGLKSEENESSKPAPMKLIGQKSKEESDKPVAPKKFVEQKSKEDESAPVNTAKKLVEQESKDEPVLPAPPKKLVEEKRKEDESATPNSAKNLVGQKSKEDELTKPAAPKKLVGQKSKEEESDKPAAPKKLVGQKSKDEEETDKPAAPKKLVGQKSKEEETDKHVTQKKLVGQKSKEDESTKPAAPKKLVGQKSKEESDKPAAPKKLVGQKNKGEERKEPVVAKKLVQQKCKEDESTKPEAPKKLVGQKSKEDESTKPAPKKLVARKNKGEETKELIASKELVEQKSKEDESTKSVAPKKLVREKAKEEDSVTPTTAKKLVGQKGKQVSSVEPDTQTSSPAGGKKIVGRAKVDVAQSSDKIRTAKPGLKKKKEIDTTKPASEGTKVGAKVQPSPDKGSHGSDADSEESSSEDEDSTPRNCTSTSSVSSGSTSSSGSSSSDSGFDSRPSSVPGSPPSNKKVSSTASEASGSREPGSPAPSAYSATLDPYSEDAGLLQSGSSASGRTTPPATSLPRFRKYTVDDFQFLKLLGKGTFGKVLLAELRGTDRHYAVKCLKKDVVLEDDDVECTLIERKVLALGTKHPYLCHLFCTFQTESHLLFVMEYLNGGDLMFHIQQSGRFPEPRARFYAAEIVCGLKFLHKKGIVYRDLKLDNILLDYEGHVRIADFGMCKLQIFLDRTADTFCGTPDYMAPEIIKGLKYNQCVDWWSFGVLTFEMLVGVSPFTGCDEDELFWSICNEQPQYPRFLSREAHSLLSSLLEKDALKRLGTPDSPKGDVPDHVFFRSIDWGALERRELEAPFRPRVKHPLDVQYFDTAFTAERPELTPVDASILQSMDQTQFHGFSYTNPNATD